jgi:hypothetical protein
MMIFDRDCLKLRAVPAIHKGDTVTIGKKWYRVKRTISRNGVGMMELVPIKKGEK